MLNVLIVNTYLTGGGAAIAATRLAGALNDSGKANVAMLTLKGEEQAGQEFSFEHEQMVPGMEKRWRERLNFYAERAEIFLRNGGKRKGLFHISTALWGADISKHPLVRKADVIHLHWICQGMLSLKGLEKLASLKKKIVWTLHDMWPCTAVSPHLKNPNVYESPWSNKEYGLVNRVYQLKKRIYPQLKPAFVGCSEWIAQMAKCSDLTNAYKIVAIPNPIDTHFFAPAGKKKEEFFSLLFGAVQTGDERKGFKEMAAALQLLKKRGVLQKNRIRVESFGHLSADAQKALGGIEIVCHGFIDSAEKMANLYRSAHCLAVPSLFENLPNTIMESLSCGTPVVAFKTGGIPEMIVDGKTGFLCDYASPEALAKGIEQLSSMPENIYSAMASDARSFAIEHYDNTVIAQKMLAFYDSL